MNIYNRTNGFSESSLNSQSEMQSCKLNDSESRPNLTLRKIGQELDIAETKCFTLKSELNYMMGVCRKAQTEIKGNKGTSDTLHEQNGSLSENMLLKSSIENDDQHHCIEIANEIPNYKIFQQVHNNEQKAEENLDIPHLSPNSVQFSPRKNTFNNDDIDKSESTGLKEVKQKRLLNAQIIPRVQLHNTFPTAITAVPVQNKNVVIEEYKNVQSCYSEHMQKYFQSMLNAKESVNELTSKDGDEDYFCVLPSSAREDIRNPELNLNIPDNTEIRSIGKDTHISKMEKRKTDSKANDTVPKVRKRKGKLRSSISKSTVTTKNTNFRGSKKEGRRRKQRGHNVALHQSIFPKISKKSNDVVEIFHNTTIKSSNSALSSKHFKLDSKAKYIKKQITPQINNQKVQERTCFDSINYERQSHNKENKQHHCLQSLDCQSNSGAISAREEHNSEKHSDVSSTLCKINQCERTIINRSYDPTLTPSYEMPTLASKLKRSNRSYFNRFNFRNIPFVVGTSVTPSYNLGLNIQQVLSVMKMRQPAITNVKPMSFLLQQLNGQCEKPFLNMNSQRVEKVQSLHIPDACQGDMKRASEKDNSISGRSHKEKDGLDRNHKLKSQRAASSFDVNKCNISENTKDQEEIAKMSLNRKDIMGDHKMHIPISHDSKEIRDVFINLHDQFEEMNTKYEKLQLKAEKSNDKSLIKELSAMEKELNNKEEEINTVIGLYKEVMMLKQQMKMMHEKNSLVCIATGSPTVPNKNSFPISFMSHVGKSRLMSPAQVFNRKKGNVYNATREPPTSIQLAALLRQIQTFHKQLQLVT